MANIPVEKTASGAAWLPWLLGLLALAAIGFVIFLAMDDPDNDDVAAADGTGEVRASNSDDASEAAAVPSGDNDASADTLTTLAAISEAIAGIRDGDIDPAGLAISLNDVEVQALTGDSTFAIGTGENRTLVVLTSLGESEVGPGDGADGVFNVDTGETVSIDGSLVRYAPNMRGTSDLSASDADEASRRQYVISVREPERFSIAD